MPELDEILHRLNQLSEEVRELKARFPQASGEATPAGRDTVLMGIIEQIRGYIDTQQSGKSKEKYICHAILAEPDGEASVQVTWLEAVMEEDAFSTASYCLALANEHRINILKALADAEKTTARLAELTGIEGGPLYHHLKELNNARFIQQRERGLYGITRAGLDALLTVCALNRRNTWEHSAVSGQKGAEDEYQTSGTNHSE